MSDAAGPPPMPPPCIPGSDFSKETNGPLIVGVMTALTTLTLLFVIARLYSRMISVGKIAIDDWLIVLSMVLGLWFLGMSGAAVHYGGGRHIMCLDPKDTTTVIKLTVISFVPGLTSFAVPKLAVVILLAKLLNPSRIHVICMWIMSVVYMLLIAAMLAMNFGQCTPAASQWDQSIPGTCMDRKIVVYYAMAVTIASVFFDFYLAIYPTIILWQLQLNTQKKLALCASLGFGYCAVIVTIYKTTTFPGLFTLMDYTYALGNVVLWTNIEANCVIIGACIPILLPLMKKIFGSSAFGSTGRATGGPSGMSGQSAKKSNGQSTFGSYQSGQNGTTKSKKKLSSHFDNMDDSEDSKYIILEERSFQYTTKSVEDEDASVLERAKATRQEGW